MLDKKQLDDNSWVVSRRPFDATTAKYYTVSAKELETLKHLGVSFQEARTAHDGYLRSWTERGQSDHDGKHWVTLQEPAYEYAAEFAVGANGAVTDVVPVPPEKAYEMAKAHDGPAVKQG